MQKGINNKLRIKRELQVVEREFSHLNWCTNCAQFTKITEQSLETVKVKRINMAKYYLR